MLQKNNYDKKVGSETVKMRRVKVKVQSFQLVGKKAGDSETPDEGGDEAILTTLFDGKGQGNKRKRA